VLLVIAIVIGSAVFAALALSPGRCARCRCFARRRGRARFEPRTSGGSQRWAALAGTLFGYDHLRGLHGLMV
jgi:hypothetical protein